MIIYSSKKNKSLTIYPLPEIVRVDALKMLGVTFENNLSVNKHVSNVCQAAAQTYMQSSC